MSALPYSNATTQPASRPTCERADGSAVPRRLPSVGRIRRMKEYARAGLDSQQIAEREGIGRDYVTQIARTFGIRLRHKPRLGVEPVPARYDVNPEYVARLFQAGMTTLQIAARLNVPEHEVYNVRARS